MTPAQHATRAQELLTEAATPYGSTMRLRLHRVAGIHAILANAPGTGTAYTSAQELLAGHDAGTKGAGRWEQEENELRAYAHLALLG